MKQAIVLSIICLACGAFIKISTDPGQQDVVPYPEGFRMWTHVKTSVVGPKNPAYSFVGGFDHIYANEKAMKGYTTGIFEDGAVVVFDVIIATDKDGDLTEGERKVVDVMMKDAVKFKDTGGWGFEEFKGNSKTERTVLQAASARCFSCHSNQKDKNYIFSSYRP